MSLSSLFSNSKAFKSVTRTASLAPPVVKTIQAIDGILNAGNLLKNANTTSEGLNEVLPKASHLLDRVEAFVPSFQVMSRSFCDSIKIITSFNMIATSVGIGANIVLTYQGVQALQLIASHLNDINSAISAHTALIAQKDFPSYVYDLIRERVGQTADDSICDHWFFVWHPDNDFYPKFYHLLEEKPISPAFCGYTNQIDTAFAFMMAARQYITARERKALARGGKAVKPVMLHLLIPAYQPVVVAEALKIPEELGDFVIEGRVNSNKPFVWMNLPIEDKKFMVDIGQWSPPPPSWFQYAKEKFGFAQSPLLLKERRLLGVEGIRTFPPAIELDDNSTEVAHELLEDAPRELLQKKDGAKRRQDATPLHAKPERRRRSKRNRSSVVE